MSWWSSIGDRLRRAWKEGGISGVASTASGYFAWKLSGAPPDTEEHIEARLDRAESAAIVMLMRDWFAQASVSTSPLVSVILPTKNREAGLKRAIESVSAQSYENWELVVINDHTEGSTLLRDHVTKDRVRVIESGGVGVGAARNLGLAHASGEIITFLDDDNVMDRHWLKSVVLTLAEHPEADVMIGAQIVSPEPGSSDAYSVRFPGTFDWRVLVEYNYVDMGMLAHRAQSELKFDEDLPALVDWDYVVRLTVDRAPVMAPALSGIYFTGAPGRISYQDRDNLHKTLQAQFSSLGPGPSSPGQDNETIGAHDQAAIETLIQRKKAVIGKDLRILIVGDTEDLRAISSRLSDQNLVHVSNATDLSSVPIGEGFDLIVVDGTDTNRLADALGPDGVVLGLNAHQQRYQLAGLGFERRVGDKLWVGSLIQSDLEQLFEGATLVKLGIPVDGEDQP